MNGTAPNKSIFWNQENLTGILCDHLEIIDVNLPIRGFPVNDKQNKTKKWLDRRHSVIKLWSFIKKLFSRQKSNVKLKKEILNFFFFF